MKKGIMVNIIVIVLVLILGFIAGFYYLKYNPEFVYRHNGYYTQQEWNNLFVKEHTTIHNICTDITQKAYGNYDLQFRECWIQEVTKEFDAQGFKYKVECGCLRAK